MTDDRDDIGYWDALANRVTSTVLRNQEPGTLNWLAESRTAMVAAVVLALLGVAVMTLPSNRVANTAPVLAPTDRVGQLMADTERPPAIGALLTEPLEQRQR